MACKISLKVVYYLLRYVINSCCSDMVEDQSLGDSSASTVKPDDSVLSSEGAKTVFESQLKTEEKPVTYHADFEMPVFNIQVCAEQIIGTIINIFN